MKPSCLAGLLGGASLDDHDDSDDYDGGGGGGGGSGEDGTDDDTDDDNSKPLCSFRLGPSSSRKTGPREYCSYKLYPFLNKTK